MTLYWLGIYAKPTHVLVYEDVRKDPLTEMYTLVTFLGINIDFQSLYCLSICKNSTYHRQKPTWMNVDQLFDDSMRTIVNTNIHRLIGSNVVTKNIVDVLHSYVLPLISRH